MHSRLYSNIPEDGLVHLLILMLVVIVVIGIGGWIVWRQTYTFNASTTLVISRQNPLNQTYYPTLKPVKVTDSNVVSAIYSDIHQLPMTPNSIYNCPSDDGVNYLLQFSNHVKATVQVSGCELVSINSEKNSRWMLSATQAQDDHGTDLQKQIAKAINQNFRYN